MVKPSGGTFSGKTKALKGRARISVAQRVKSFEVGSKVVLRLKCDYKGLPHVRYAGRHGTIIERRGKSYVVEVKDGGKSRKLIVGPVHLEFAA